MRPSVIVVMGVAGAGKTTIGTRLARTLGWSFADADAYHTAEHVARMEAGIPLTDADRAPWLARLRAVIAEHHASGRPLVLACSALRADYRVALVPPELPRGAVRFVYLRVPAAVVASRLGARVHGVGPALAASQFATLEEPADALWVDATQPVERVVREIVESLGG